MASGGVVMHKKRKAKAAAAAAGGGKEMVETKAGPKASAAGTDGKVLLGQGAGKNAGAGLRRVSTAAPDKTKGQIAYGGNVYSAKNLGGLRAALRKNGMSMTRYFQNNPKAQMIIGLTMDQIQSAGQAFGARDKANAATRAAVRAKKGKNGR